MIERLQAKVYGRVQGVSFRYYAQRRARELGLKGWVRNLADGSVETLAEADRDALEAFLQFLWEGSPAAAVDRVEAVWAAAQGNFTHFEIIDTLR